MNKSINSICIVRLSALGDVLMLVPLVRTLQTYLPNAKLTWVISRPAYDLVEGLENIEFIVIDKPNNLKNFWSFHQIMKKLKFDVLIAAQASLRANLLYPLISAKRKIGYDRLRAKDGHSWFVNEQIQPGKDHTLEGFLKFASAIGIREKTIFWGIPIPEEARQWAKAHLPHEGPIFLVNPAASKPERSWLVERYIEVIKYAQTRWHAKVVLTGGPSEYDQVLGKAIAQAVSVTNLIGQTKPKQLLAVIDSADLLLCPDTGPSHMAAAVNTPVIALHAVTSANVSGPYTFRHLAIDAYPKAVTSILGETETTNIWGTHAHGGESMKLVAVEEVIEKVNEVLGSISGNRP